jgi:hypothetical protein
MTGRGVPLAVDELREADLLAAYETTFEKARVRFSGLCDEFGLERSNYPIGSAGDSLCIAHLGDRDCPRKMVVLSGVHGVEGYAGSAAQTIFLERYRRSRPQVHALLVHVVNPDGMRHFRRTAPGNIDLNRNLVAGRPAGAGVDERSRAVAALLSSRTLSRLPGPIWLAWVALRLPGLGGMAKLRDVFAAGQHFDPASLFYGGLSLAAETETLIAALGEALSGCASRDVIFFDLHSGIGAFGRPSLLANGGDAGTASRVFGVAVRQGHEGEASVYRVQGDLVQGVKSALGLDDACAVTFECGTGPAIATLLRLRYENGARHHFPASRRRRSRARRRMLRAFCPTSAHWRTTYVRAANHFLDRALIHLSAGGKHDV